MIKDHDRDPKTHFFLVLVQALFKLASCKTTETLQLDFQMYWEALKFVSWWLKGLNGQQGCEQQQPGEDCRSVVISDKMILNSLLFHGCLPPLSWHT